MPCPAFPCPPQREWSAGRRQGAALRRPWGCRCVTPDTPRALQGRVCETRPEARTGDDLEACEAPPPNRCASRRSTPQASVSLRRQQRACCRRPHSLFATAPHECAGAPNEVRAGESRATPAARTCDPARVASSARRRACAATTRCLIADGLQPLRPARRVGFERREIEQVGGCVETGVARTYGQRAHLRGISRRCNA